MSNYSTRKLIRILALCAVLFLALRYSLGLILPFLAGLLIALAAEPAVKFLCGKLRISRGPAAFLGVSLALILLSGITLLLCSALIKGLGSLSALLPDLEGAVRQGLVSLQDWLLSLAMKAPEGLRNLLTKIVLGLFNGGGTLYSEVVSQLPGLATGLISRLTGGALGIGTGVLSAYLISARLPVLKAWLAEKLPESWTARYLPALGRMKTVLAGWLKAQGKLMGLTFFIVFAGLLLLGISYAPVWAAAIALVDAVPMLGTGIILVPWSLICFLQGAPMQAIGLLAVFAAATLSRSAMEPRLVGRQLGLDPLVTLLALYLGYRLMGIGGMIAAPLLAVIVTQAVQTTPEEQ